MQGTAFTFVTTENARNARELITILREAKAVVPPELEEMAYIGGGSGGSSRGMLLFNVGQSHFNVAM